jgi:O-antigen ligase
VPKTCAIHTTEFEAVERRDPTWSAIHLLAAMAWCAAISLGRAPEAICFGILAAVTVIRLPSTARLYPALLRSPMFVALLAFAAWRWIAVSWSPNAQASWKDGFLRASLVPALVWPMSHRWRQLAVAMAAGAVASAAVLVTGNWNGHRFMRYTEAKRLIGTPATMAMVLSMGISLASAGAMAGRTRAGRSVAAIAAVIGVGGMLVLDFRTGYVAAFGGLFCAAAGAARDPRRRWALLGGAAAAAVGGIILIAGTSLRGSHSIDPLRALATERDGPASGRLDGAGLAQIAYEVTSARSPAWIGAVDIWRSHPIIGAGTRSWGRVFPPIVNSEPARLGIPPDRVEFVAKLPGAHNAYLEELAERGIVGFLLLAAVLVLSARTLWRQCPAMDAVMASALLAAWMTAALAESQSSQGVPMLLLCFVVARAAIPHIRSSR